MKLSNLTIGYKNSAPIIKDIDAELLNGQFVALIGRNGSGKSTLLRTIAGLLAPLSGNIEGSRPAIVLTTAPELHHTSVRQMVTYGRLSHTGFFGKFRDDDLRAADQAIKTIGIEHLSAQLFSDLSDGEKQKVMIARALAQETSTLLLDEPSAFLDYPSRLQLFEKLQHLAHEENKAILISTHEIELVQRYTDQLWIVRDGKLIKQASCQVSQMQW